MSDPGSCVALDCVLQSVVTSAPEQVIRATQHKDTAEPVRNCCSSYVLNPTSALMQALKAVLGCADGGVLPVLLVHLPRHAASILRHAQLDPSGKLCSSSDDSNSDAEAASAVMHALVNMSKAASYSQLQELLLRLLQLAAREQQCITVAEGAALAISSMCYAAVQRNTGNRW
jgi:hypothetical protein